MAPDLARGRQFGYTIAMVSDKSWWITNARLILSDRIQKGAVEISGERILRIAPRARKGAETVSAQGAWLAPGLVDLHRWGTGEALSRQCAREGITSYLKSLAPMGKRALAAAIADAQTEVDSIGPCEGIHLEGPFLNPKRAGALPKRFFRSPQASEIADWLRSSPTIKLVTLAPELKGAQAAIRRLSRKGICVSLGHSQSDYRQALSAQKNGAQAITHLFNAMPGLHHRKPGLCAAGLLEDYTAMVIADGRHIDHFTLRMLLKVKGFKRVALVTDNIALSGWPVRKQRGAFELSDGTLAGSALTLPRAIANVVKWGELPLHQAVAMSSEIPAKLAGIKNIGRIERGRFADLALFDEKLRVLGTLRRGRWIYRRKQ